MFKMKCYFIPLFGFFLMLLSCNNNDEIRLAENLRDAKKKSVIFENINNNWIFNTVPENETAKQLTKNWTEWRIFLDELSKKPKSTIGAFQQKSRNLSVKAEKLKENIPLQFNNQYIKSRITVLITKLNSLDLYIHLNKIPDKKVIALVQEINTELEALQWQMDEVVVKSQIQIEEGESDFIKMMDTSRAIPNVPLNANQNIQ